MCHLPWIQVIWIHFWQVFRCSHCTLGIFTFSLSIQYCHVLVTEGDVNCWSVHERLSEASEKSEGANRSVGGGNNQLNNNNEQRKNMRRLQSGKIYCSPMSSLTMLLLRCSSAALPSVSNGLPCFAVCCSICLTKKAMLMLSSIEQSLMFNWTAKWFMDGTRPGCYQMWL